MTAMGERKRWMAALAVAALSSLPFSQALSFPFLLGWDDLFIVQSEQLLRFDWSSVSHWIQGNYCDQLIPVAFFSFIIDNSVGGMNPSVFHLQNLLWHAVACAGVYMCFTLFDLKPWLAFALATAYAIHPQKAESAAWIMERKDVLFGAFAVWSFYFYAKTPKESRFAPLPLALFSLSVLSKPAAISFPAILLCYELTRPRPFDFKSLALRLAPFFAISLALGVSTMRHAENVAQDSIAAKLFICAQNVLWYIWTTLAPFDLLPIYPRVSFDALSIATTLLLWLAIAAGACVLAMKGFKEFALWKAAPALAAFIAAHLTTLGLARFNAVDRADRYNYLPSAIVCFAIAWLASRLLDRVPAGKAKAAKLAAAAILSAWLASLLLTSFAYCKTFSSSLALFSLAAQAEKPNPIALDLLAVEKFMSNIPNAGSELMERLKAEKAEKTDGASEVPAGLALARFLSAAEGIQSGGPPEKIAESLKEMRALESAKLPPRFILARDRILNMLLDAELKTGEIAAAERTLGKLIEEAKSANVPLERNANFHYYSGMKSFLEGDYAAAALFFEKALDAAPSNELFKRNLKSALELRNAKSEGRK